MGDKDNLQLLIILPYIISIYNVQIHCEHFRGLQALSWYFLIMVNSPVEEFLTIFSRFHAKIHQKQAHFQKVSCKKLKIGTFSTTKFGGVWYETFIYISWGPDWDEV